MSGPRLIEVPADQKDFAEDALKAAIVLATGYLMGQYVFKTETSLSTTQNMIISVVVGLFVHHMIVDKAIVRFVVKEGQEGYYYAKKRFG